MGFEQLDEVFLIQAVVFVNFVFGWVRNLLELDWFAN